MEIKKLLKDYQALGFRVMSQEELAFIGDFIAEHSETCPVPLYRGVVLEEEFSREVGDTAEFDEDFASFTEDFDTALSFTRRDFKAAEEYLIPYAVVYKIDTKGLPVYIYTKNENELEWLLPYAKYVITEIENVEDDPRLKIVTLQPAE